MGSVPSHPAKSHADIEKLLLSSDKDVTRLVQSIRQKTFKCVMLGLCVGMAFYLFWFLDEDKSQLQPVTDLECIICQEQSREIIILPCLHFNVCKECSNNIDRCPVCRINIEKAMSLQQFQEQANYLFPE